MNQTINNITPLRQTYQIKVVLEGINPPIWRRLKVDSRITLDALHDAIQGSMGWQDEHMHQFIGQDKMIYSLPDEDGFMPDLGLMSVIDESSVLLNEVLKKEKDWIKYEYDFGDSWMHKVSLEKISNYEKNQFPVICVTGRRACPPEDSGGPWGYQRMLEQLMSHDNEYEELLEWLGGPFDSESFDIEEVNSFLKEYFTGVSFNAKPGLAKFSQAQDNMPLDFPFDIQDKLDGEVPEEIKGLLDGMQEMVSIIAELGDLVEQSADAFEEILRVSKHKQVKEIATRMLQILESDLPDKD